jgi:signal transduction histidine kinase
MSDSPPLPIASRRWIFLAFLAALHLVFLQGPETPLGRLLFLSHVGIGLLWQPFIQPRRRMGFAGTVAVVFCAALFAFFLNWGMLVVWMMLLSGVVGGKVFLFPNRSERVFHLLALGYLTIATIALALPRSLAVLQLADPVLEGLVRYGAPLVLILMALLPGGQGRRDDRPEVVDYIYGVLFFLLLAVIVLGSVSFAFVFKAGYAEALLVTLAFVSAILLLLGFLWDPRAGFGGVGSAVAQHVMSLGLPIEGWLEFLSELARSEDDPERFMERACAELPLRLPGVVGGRWEGVSSRGDFGRQDGRSVTVTRGVPVVELFTSIAPGPTLLWDYDLALRLLGEQYLGKRRAQELKRLSYIEAIHETGARLTHDVKNLLQSLETLCVAAQNETAAPSPRFVALLRRQLPEIAARLRQTLVKLSSPGREHSVEPQPATEWLKSLENRSGAEWIDFVPEDAGALAAIPYPSMFSSIAENLLQNAATKRHGFPGLRASVRLLDLPAGVGLMICDDGGRIPEETAGRLFVQHVPSDSGLGVGLFQSARLAERHGYRLSLAENRDGAVRFRLEPEPGEG